MRASSLVPTLPAEGGWNEFFRVHFYWVFKSSLRWIDATVLSGIFAGLTAHMIPLTHASIFASWKRMKSAHVSMNPEQQKMISNLCFSKYEQNAFRE